MGIKKEPKDLRLSLFLADRARTVVPFGVPDFENKEENANFIFEYHLNGTEPDTLVFEVINAENDVVFNFKLKDGFLKPGRHVVRWDGFDSQEIYNSSRFNDKRLKAKLTAVTGDQIVFCSLDFKTKYKEVGWVDVSIDRRSKRIDITLRTSFRDGGVKGSFKTRKSFDALLQLALQGMQCYWSRNSTCPVAKNIQVCDGAHYEVYVQAIQSNRAALKSPKIIYHTNGIARRSRNWELSRILYYNCGSIKYGKEWYDVSDVSASEDFKYTAAHEIGHEILLAYGGHRYSKAHKGSSTILTQSALGNFLYPQEGEIDLMVYYVEDAVHPYPPDHNKRAVASETDVLSLLWLTKIEVSNAL